MSDEEFAAEVARKQQEMFEELALKAIRSMKKKRKWVLGAYPV